MDNLNNLANLDDYAGFLNSRNHSETCKYYDIPFFNSQINFNQYNLSILNLNIRSYFKHCDEFEGFLQNLNTSFDILILTETWLNLNNSNLLKLFGYNIYNLCRNNKNGGGVSILIKDSIKSTSASKFNLINNDIETIGVELNIDNNVINILGVYRPPTGNKNIFIETLNN